MTKRMGNEGGHKSPKSKPLEVFKGNRRKSPLKQNRSGPHKQISRVTIPVAKTGQEHEKIKFL